jgi:hypothetical protein
MDGLFPDEIDVPLGTTTVRTAWGLPLGIFLILLLLAGAPFYLFGWRAWWVAGLAFLTGYLCAGPARDDVAFLEAWAGEMMLKLFYY